MFCRLLERSARNDDLEGLEEVLAGELTGGLRPSLEDCETALVRAAAHGHSQCVSRLLAEGADPDCQDPDGDTPLHAAAANGHLDVVELLLFCDCDIDTQAFDSRTALHMAVWAGNLKMAQVLLEKGCDVTLQDRYGDTPTMLCSRRGLADSKILKLLLKYDKNTDCRNEEGDTALIYAGRYGRKVNAKILIDAGADVNAKNMWGLTPLLYASCNNFPEIVEMLLEAKADVHATEPSGRGVLHYLARNGLVKCMDKVLSKGGLVDSSDSDGNTPVMEALVHNQVTMAQHLILKAACRVNFLGKATLGKKFRFCSPLEVAVYKGHFTLARLLHAAGSDLTEPAEYILSDLDLPKDSDLAQWLETEAHGPRSLAACCRLTVRNILGVKLTKAVKRLPVPSSIQAYLTFSDICMKI